MGPGLQLRKAAAVADIALDQALPVVRDLAARKANAFIRRCRLATDEREDIQSHLVLTFITRWPKFECTKSSIQTFASRLMDRELISVLRHRLAQGRRPRELPVPDTGPAAASIHQFRVDLDRVMASLPEVVRKTAAALAYGSTADVASTIRCSRQMVNRRKQQIRETLVAAGITANYFAGERAGR